MLLKSLLVVLSTSLISVLAGNEDTNPIVDLGVLGKYKGALQNDGTVHAFKGIPYAQPPVGDLRFKSPRKLDSSTASEEDIIDVSDDALRCVQFGPDDIFGVKAGPGTEDCLKVWIWKPASAEADKKLPVLAYIHGGGLRYNAAANDDMSDWVKYDQGFIVVNIQYRLGGFGFLASNELAEEGEPKANAGLLDMKLGLEWIQQNIEKFGGDKSTVTLMGQSGGGLAVLSLLTMYHEKEAPFKRAIVRSAQREPTFTVDELENRNQLMQDALECDNNIRQLDCFRNVTPEEFVNAYVKVVDKLPDMYWASFLPSIDGEIIPDTMTKLFKRGHFAKVPVIVSFTTHEGANTIERGGSLNETSLHYKNLSAEDTSYAFSLYPVNSTFGDPSNTDVFFKDSYFAAVAATGISFGEGKIAGSERLVGRYYSEYAFPDKTWSLRFNAPIVNTTYDDEGYPYALVSHSSENVYLQNKTEDMRPFERAVANEFRGYLSSFVKNGDPNTERPEGSVEWHPYAYLKDYLRSPIRMVFSFNYTTSSQDDDKSTGSGIEVVPPAQLFREDWWQSDEIVEQIKV